MKEMTTASPAEERPCPRTSGWSGTASPLLPDPACRSAIATSTPASMEFAQGQQSTRRCGRQRPLCAGSVV